LHEGYSNRRYAHEQPVPGMTVIRCPVWLPKRLTGLTRLIHLATFALTSFPVMMRLVLWQPAVVFVVAPALFSAPAGWLTARLCGAKAWLHIQDLEIDAAFELGLLKGKLLRGATKAFERSLMRGFDVVSTISRRMLRQLASKGVSMDRTELLPNWVDLAQVRPTDRSQALRDELGIGADQFVCLFSGTINRKQGLGVLIDAARQLADDPRIVLVICGSGELRPLLESDAVDLPNVRFMDLRPASELNALLNMADIHLLPQLRGAADLVMPSKLTGMLASGRPIVAAAIPGTEIASVVEGRGIVTEPECAKGFAESIIALVTDTQRRIEYGIAARAYAERVLDAGVLFGRLDSRLLAVCRVPSEPVDAPVGEASAVRRAASDV
jgi:colanic acid biosynthesis glycosyl transferase WcaI